MYQLKYIIGHSMPHPILLMFFLSSYQITKQSDIRFQQQLLQNSMGNKDNDIIIQQLPLSLYVRLAATHVSMGITCLAFIAIGMYQLERPFGKAIQTMMHTTTHTKQKQQ